MDQMISRFLNAILHHEKYIQKKKKNSLNHLNDLFIELS